jgi:hypothetical protein
VIESKGGSKEEDVVVPVKYRVPSLRDEDVRALTDVLLQGGANECTYHRATTVLGQFGMLPSNRERSLAAISESTSRLGDVVTSAFKTFVSSLPSATIESSLDSRALAVQEFSMAASEDELTVLPIAKAVSVLVKGVVDFKPSSAQAVEGVVQNEELSEEARMDNEMSGMMMQILWMDMISDSLWLARLVVDIVGAVLDAVQQKSAKDDACMTEAKLKSPAGRLQAVVQSRAQATAAYIRSESAATNEPARGFAVGKAYSLSPSCSSQSDHSVFLCLSWRLR